MYSTPILVNSTNGRTKPHSLTLALYNADSLLKQREEVADLLNRHKIDILAVQETYLKPKHRRFNIAKYSLLRTDRLPTQDRPNNPKGGTAIYYKKSLHVCSIVTPQLDNCEATAIRIAMSGHDPIVIASVYLPAGQKMIANDIKALLELGSTVILAGDFNSKHQQWNCNETNTNGRTVHRLLESLDDCEVIAPYAPTHYPYTADHRPDILSYCIFKNISLPVRDISVLSELHSDHRPVLYYLGRPFDQPTETRTVINNRKFKQALSKRDPRLDITSEIDNRAQLEAKISDIGSSLNEALTGASSEVPVQANHRFELPEDLRLLLSAKNAAQRDYDNCPSDNHRIQMRRLQREVTRCMRELRGSRMNDFVSSIAPSHTAIFKFSKYLKSDEIVPMPPLKRDNQPAAFDDDEKAECLADSLETQCTPSSQPIDPDHLNMVNSEVEHKSSLPPIDSLPEITLEEVQKVIKELKPKKAPGLDRITNMAIKSFPLRLLTTLTVIFNASLRLCAFPTAWKEADVIGFHKPRKDRTDPTCYRPISLLSSIGKVYERLILNRLKDICIDKNLIPNEQFGFRPKHSCVQQVHRITEHIYKGFHTTAKSKDTGAIFFDVAKAFDKVWHNGLIYKLYQLNLPDRLVLIIKDYLTERSFCYRVEKSRSRPHPIAAGVPQGSVLSPTLFSLYVQDVPRTPYVELALYADDTALYYTSRKRARVCQVLQKAVTDLGEWALKWRIEMNPEKSAAVLFSRGKTRADRASSSLPEITLFDRPIPWENKVKYLGVTLDSRLNFKSHIKTVRDKAAFYMSRLHPLMRSKSNLPLRCKITLFKTCIRPVFTYASPVFAHCSHSLKPLQVLQNRFMRKAVGAPWYMRNVDLHSDFRLPTVKQYMKEASERFFINASSHPNPLIVQASLYDPTPDINKKHLFKRRPKDVLLEPEDDITKALKAQPPPAPQARQLDEGCVPEALQRLRYQIWIERDRRLDSTNTQSPPAPLNLPD